jgi:pilus assembly protein CpaF
MANFPQDKNPKTTTSGFGRRAGLPKAPAKEAHRPRTPEEERKTVTVPNSTTEPSPRVKPSNSNRLATVHPAANEAEEHHEQLSPYLETALRTIWEAIKKSADFRQFASMSRDALYEDMMLTIDEIMRFNELKLSRSEAVIICKKIVDEMVGLGPIEPLLKRDEVTEIMVNGPKTVFLEINGVIERSAITFRDNAHLTAVCQRIAGQIGRRVDESSPICDARLVDGSRVNIILSPLSVEGATLTIRKFQREKLTLEKLVHFGSVDENTAEMIRIIAACRINILISGGTGSGKTTLLNCLTRYINPRERIVTCEDACELQLQQPHVVKLETRPANMEGFGEVTMRDLVRNCLRMRPDRIIVGEVRGPEAFDLLQAMNTGHDGSMGTVHANTPRDGLARLENMVAMGRLNIPVEALRRQIASSVHVVIQIQRLPDGSRKIMSISEVTGMEGDMISMQDLVSFHIEGENAQGRIMGSFKATGLRPKFSDKLRQFGMEERFLALLGKKFGY